MFPGISDKFQVLIKVQSKKFVVSVHVKKKLNNRVSKDYLNWESILDL